MTPTIVDTIVVIIIALSTLLAWSRGITREALTIVGWLIAALIARQFAYSAVPIVEQIPYVTQFIESCELRTIFGFVIVFVVAMIVMAIITPLFSGLVQNSFFSAFDSGLGAIFGFIRGVLIVMLLFFLYGNQLQQTSPFEWVEQSRSFAMLQPSPEAVETDMAEEASGVQAWFGKQVAAMASNCPIETEAEVNG